MRVQKTNALTRKKAPKEKQSKKMRRENIIRIIPKRFQCGLRVFHSILDCNHSLASFATVLFCDSVMLREMLTLNVKLLLLFCMTPELPSVCEQHTEHSLYVCSVRRVFCIR